MTKNPVILLRSSWQSVNIGDIAHTPGLLRVLQRFYPEAEVVLWPCNIGHGAGDMLRRHFPNLLIVEGGLDSGGYPMEDELKEIWKRADIFLHGSGPGLMEYKAAYAWYCTTGKPYGFMGVTAENPKPDQVDSVQDASFLLTRETASLRHLERAGVKGPRMQFCPDATFSCDLRDDARAEAFLAQEGLKGGDFVCMIPRLRYTPYHKIHQLPSTEEWVRRDAVNAEFAQADHSKMRVAITRIVRETGLTVLICPEMTYQIDHMDELLIDGLPEDVKGKVKARRTYWLPDEAASVYARARSVVSFECHSPILALRQGVPVMYLRQPTDSIKGQMWRDVGLERYILEIDEVSAEEVAEIALSQLTEPESTALAMRQALENTDRALSSGVSILMDALSQTALTH